jgi:hypothetical protein
MADIRYRHTVHHDAWHYLLRLVVKARSWVHDRRLLWQFSQMDGTVPKEAPFGVLKGGGYVDLARRHPTKRAWIDWRGRTVRSCAFTYIDNMENRDF